MLKQKYYAMGMVDDDSERFVILTESGVFGSCRDRDDAIKVVNEIIRFGEDAYWQDMELPYMPER